MFAAVICGTFEQLKPTYDIVSGKVSKHYVKKCTQYLISNVISSIADSFWKINFV